LSGPFEFPPPTLSKMTYRVATPDGLVMFVDQADLEIIKAYLVLHGYPDLTVDAVSKPLPELCGPDIEPP